MKIIEEYNLQHCIRPLRIELYNILRSSLDSICAPVPDSNEGKVARDVLIGSLSYPAYKDILLLKGDSYINIEFMNAFENNDIDWLYNFYNAIYKRKWKKRLLVKILSKF